MSSFRGGDKSLMNSSRENGGKEKKNLKAQFCNKRRGNKETVNVGLEKFWVFFYGGEK